MPKITLPTVQSGYYTSTALNAIFDQIELEFDKVFYRNNPVATPNSLSNDMDLNGNDVLNGGSAFFDKLILNGVDFTETASIISSYLTQAEAARDAALLAEATVQTLSDNFHGTYYGPLVADPSVDPLGNASSVGDLYFNTTTNTLRLFDGAAWNLASVDPSTLGSAATYNVGMASNQIPTNGDLGSASQADIATLSQALAGAAGVLPDAEQVRRNHVAQVATIADLRALEPALDGQQVELLGRVVASIGGGTFYADLSDSTTTDDGVNTIVTPGGKRWKRRDVNYSEQPDFVEMLASHSEFDGMYFKRENSLGWITVMLKRGNKHVSWSFRNNEHDDYWILGDCFTGTVSNEDVVSDNADYSSLSGTGWVTTAPNAHYTTVIGDTFTATSTGERIDFNFYGDDRGGVWSFVVDGDTGNAVEVSTYRSVASAYTETVFSGLTNTAHTIVGTFIGDDPLNPPSGGTGTSRGWVWYSNGTNTLKTLRAYAVTMVNSRDIELLEGFSNKEFAVSIRPAGATEAHQFVPMHSGIGTAFEKTPKRIVLDGTEIDPFSFTTGFFQPCNSLVVSQSVYGRHSEYPSNNLIEVNTTVSINKKGIASISGTVEVLADIDINAGYFMMCPTDAAATTKATTSLNNVYDTTIADGSKTYLVPEMDRVRSVLFTSEVNGDVAVAVVYDNISETLRQNGDGKFPHNLMCWIEHRDSGIQKLYQSVFNSTTRTAGEKFSFSGRLGGFVVPGINRAFK